MFGNATSAENTESSTGKNETGSHAKTGFAGSLRAAEKHAPSETGDKSIKCVAWIAHQNGLNTAEIKTLWNRIIALSDSGEETPAKATLEQWGDAE